MKQMEARRTGGVARVIDISSAHGRGNRGRQCNREHGWGDIEGGLGQLEFLMKKKKVQTNHALRILQTVCVTIERTYKVTKRVLKLIQ